jgi:hypothetical protein
MDSSTAGRRVHGRVSSRSSRGGAGPPGENEILALNPQREVGLKRLMNWPRLEPGTLNVQCDEAQLQELVDSLRPAWVEVAASVLYPPKYSYIPGRRGGYRYFHATLCASGATIVVLVRRAIVPVRGRLEVFADCNLRSAAGLADGDAVTLILSEKPEPA